MYIPRPFLMPQNEVASLLRSLHTGHLVTATSNGLLATFLPLIFDPEVGPQGSLLGHLARPNAQWSTPATDALIIVEGSNGYISPSWYASKSEHGRVVPTWDYLLMHVHGTLGIHDDTEWVRDIVTRLTDRSEAASAQPWAVTDAPADYVDRQLQAIVGVELTISRVEASAKLSQNRPGDSEGVVRGLTDRGFTGLADEVRRHRRAPS